jgi:hypothetical protein
MAHRCYWRQTCGRVSFRKELSIMFETTPSEEQIQRRAYKLFLQRGCEHGRDMEDWLEAERELNELAGLRAVETELAANEEPLAESEEPIVLKKQAAAAGVEAVVVSAT